MKGFTLLEVMIAMAILAIGLTAAYYSQSQSVSMAASARFMTTASLLAQGKMAEMEGNTAKEIVADRGNFGEDHPDYEWQLEVADSEMENLKRLKLTVTNNRMTVNNTFEIVLYKTIAK
ncbi:MAG: prepilin-type N-terminal cleavage/methylation domain-containing protein [Syntrophales bacterium]|nr:prepilin-type N-terminal cleavage/methylation domain-containing protein [Syntrophales bacterium]